VPRLEILLLGHLEISFDGAPWHFSVPPRAAGLLGYLAVHAGESVSRASLAAMLWPDEPDDEARSKLRRYLHLLQRALPPSPKPWFAATVKTLAWESRPDAQIDVVEFVRAAGERRYADAIERYRGPFLDGYYEEWVLAERERFAERFMEVCRTAAIAARRDRDFDAAIRYTDRMLAVDEWREDALRLAMTCRYESGDRSAALALFKRYAARLASEVKVEPSPETRALHGAILENASLPGGFAAGDDAEVRSAPGAPFVGRVAELASLTALWVRAAKGIGTTVFLSGVAGAGKSRLLLELSGVAGALGGRTLTGGVSSPEAYPYEPFVDALRGSIAGIATSKMPRVWLASLAAILPELHGALPDLPEPEPLDPARAQTRLFEAISRAVQELARIQPILIVLEDVQWSQSATIGAIEAVARRIGASAVLLVVTYRADEVAERSALNAARDRLRAEQRETSMVLQPLETGEIDAMVRHGYPQATPELVAWVCARSDGNPLFANQLLQTFLEAADPEAEFSQAQTVGAAVLARMNALEEPVRALAETAATIGRSFTLDVATRVLGWSEDDILRALGVLLDRSIVREAGGGALTYAFTHASIAEAVYGAMALERRSARHGRIAQVMVNFGAGDPWALATIARHWKNAGESERASVAYLKAASAALQTFAREEAATYAHEAYELAAEDTARFDALEIACGAQYGAVDVGGWNEDLHRLERLGESLGNDRWFAALRHRQKYAVRVADTNLQQRTIATMFELARASDSPPLLVDAFLARSARDAQVGDIGAAVASLSSALGLCESIGDDEKTLEIRLHLVTAFARSGDLPAARAQAGLVRALSRTSKPSPQFELELLGTESAIAAISEDGPWLEQIGNAMVELAQVTGDLYNEGKGHFMLGHAAYSRFDYRTVRERYARAGDLWISIGAREALRGRYFNHSAIESRIGRWDIAMSLLDLVGPSIEAGSAADYLYATGRSAALLGLGHVPEALATARRAYDIALKLSERRFVDEALVALGTVAVEAGSFDDAIAHLTEALTRSQAREAWRDVVDALCGLIDALDGAGRVADAAPYAAELNALVAKGDKAKASPKACATLARFAAAMGRDDERRAWSFRGRTILADLLAKLVEPGDAAACAALPFHRALLDAG
jgi:DNA-binding SARP family transcriptional activator/tetratricopeptide (TPR) repeat protein